MKNGLDLLFMILQSLSIAIIDMFYFMTAFVAFMTVYRFGQFGVQSKNRIKHARDITVEYIVQGIIIGALLSCVVVYLGMPIMYSDYLYFLLPLSFMLGFYHIRFTNLIYSASMMGFLGLVMNGQTIGTQIMPDIGINPSGLALVTGLLMLFLGLMMAITGTRNLMPIAAVDGQRKVLGFAMQRFWPIPMVVLAAVKIAVTGETIEMPNWWPILTLSSSDDASFSLFLLPLLLIMSHGSVSFGQSPKEHLRVQYLQQIGGGFVLLVGGYFGSQVENVEIIMTLILILVAAVPEAYWHYKELGRPPCYTLEESGAMIIGVVEGSQAMSYGFELGDCILSINDNEIKDWGQLCRRAKMYDKSYHVKLLRQSKESLTIHVDQGDLTDTGFGLRALEAKPSKYYDIEDITHMNMMHLMRFNRKKDDSE